MGSILTPNQADPNTGLVIPLLGWHFIETSIEDVFAGCNLIYMSTGGPKNGWYPDIGPDPMSTTDPPAWYLVFKRTGYPPVIINNTDWFAFDTRNPIALTQDVVSSEYTVTTDGS